MRGSKRGEPNQSLETGIFGSHEVLRLVFSRIGFFIYLSTIVASFELAGKLLFVRWRLPQIILRVVQQDLESSRLPSRLCVAPVIGSGYGIGEQRWVGPVSIEKES